MILTANNISKSFGKVKVLQDVSFGLEAGTITGIVGRNGSGKTTLLKILSGIYVADSGESLIFDKNIKDNPRTISHLTFLPDRFDYFNYYKAKDIPDFYKVIYERFDSDYFFNELNKNKIDPNQNMRNFSKGSKNLIGLITVLASSADIILVDEVLDGMDVLNKNTIINYILDAKEAGKTILASSHDLDALAGICENILYLSIDGRVKELAADKTNIKKVQVVVEDKLPKELASDSIILSSLGRVYIILIEDKNDLLESYLKDTSIVQYDMLNLKIEDYFYMEAGGKNV